MDNFDKETDDMFDSSSKYFRWEEMGDNWKKENEIKNPTIIARKFIRNPEEDFMENLKALYRAMLETDIPKSEFEDIFKKEYSRNSRDAKFELRSEILSLCEKIQRRKEGSDRDYQYVFDAYDQFISDRKKLERVKRDCDTLIHHKESIPDFNFVSDVRDRISDWQKKCQLVVEQILINNPKVKLFLNERIAGLTEEVKKDLSHLFSIIANSRPQIFRVMQVDAPAISRMLRHVKNVERNFRLLSEIENLSWNIDTRLHFLKEFGLTEEELKNNQFMHHFQKFNYKQYCDVFQIADYIGFKGASPSGRTKNVRRKFIGLKPHSNYDVVEATKIHCEQGLANEVGETIYVFKRGTKFKTVDVIRARLRQLPDAPKFIKAEVRL